MNSDFIRFLEEIGKHDTGFAGGKGANLGEIFRARLPVPPAFVVTTKAYEVFSKSHGLEQKIERILSRIDVDDFANLEKGAAEIRRIVESSALPGEVSRSRTRLRRTLQKVLRQKSPSCRQEFGDDGGPQRGKLCGAADHAP